MLNFNLLSMVTAVGSSFVEIGVLVFALSFGRMLFSKETNEENIFWGIAFAVTFIALGAFLVGLTLSKGGVL